MKKQNKTFILVLISMLTAASIILARVLGFYPVESIRISFECVPILLAGIWLGPLAGALVGGIADFLGSILSGLGFYPPLIATPILLGLVSGFLAKIPAFQAKKIWQLASIVLVSEVIGNIFVSPLPLSWLYGTPYWTLLVLRLPWKLLILVADAFFVTILHRFLYRSLMKKMV